MKKVIMEANGRNANMQATFQLLESCIRIKRFAGQKFIEKVIPFNQISSMEFKEATSNGWFGSGYLYFYWTGISLLDRFMDEHVFQFLLDENKNMIKIKAFIEKNRHERLNSSYILELEQLAELRDKGIITDKEFNDKKKKLLGI